jgi:predicted lipoprotein with Yx(FWY)xxD motif
MHRSILTAALAAQLLLTGAALALAADNGPLKVQATSAGNVLADPNGMTLYTFDKDTPGKSNCNGKCAEFWPPVKATADSKPVGNLTIITRDDGSKQWADNGKPLYTFAKDTKPGDVTGDGFLNGAWHLAMP